MELLDEPNMSRLRALSGPITIGPDQTVRGDGSILGSVINQGVVDNDGGMLEITGWVQNEGTLRSSDRKWLDVLGPVTSSGSIEVRDRSGMELHGGATITGDVLVDDHTTLILHGAVDSAAPLRGPDAGSLTFDNATVANQGRTITADNGCLVVRDSTINGGVLRATDATRSAVVFEGDVTLNGVAWEDPGEGVFRTREYRTTQFHGDYADHLPAGYTLIVLCGGLAIPVDEFINDGRLEVSGSDGAPAVLSLGDQTRLLGSGEVILRDVDLPSTGIHRVAVPEMSPLLVTLDAVAGDHRNELFVKLGGPPSRGDYGHRFGGIGADQQVLVPMAAPATWYILLYSDHAPAPSGYTLLATAPDVVLTDVTPDHHGNATDMALTLTGAGFGEAMTVELVSAGATAYPAATVGVHTPGHLTAACGSGRELAYDDQGRKERALRAPHIGLAGSGDPAHKPRAGGTTLCR